MRYPGHVAHVTHVRRVNILTLPPISIESKIGAEEALNVNRDKKIRMQGEETTHPLYYGMTGRVFRLAAET